MFQLLKAQGLGSVPSTHPCQADSQPLQLQLSASAGTVRKCVCICAPSKTNKQLQQLECDRKAGGFLGDKSHRLWFNYILLLHQ